MKVKFKIITLKNFLSYGNSETVFTLDTHKSTLITAKNGAGKSSLILDSLCYVCFNKPYRDIKLGQLVNSINNKNSVVTCEFDIGPVSYKVVRGQKPSIFEIWKNGELVKEEASTRDYQALLETILGFNYKTFKQIVVIGSANYVPFMQLDAKDRRSVIEEILDIGVFSIMSEFAKKELADLKSTLTNIDYEISLLKQQLTTNEKLHSSVSIDIEQMNKVKQEKILDITNKISQLENDEKELIEKILELSKSPSDDSELQTAMRKLDVLIGKHETITSQSEHTISFFGNHDTCPKCNQQISPDLKNTTILNEERIIADAESKMCEYTAIKNDLLTKISARKSLAQKIAMLDRDKQTIQHSLVVARQTLASLNKEIQVNPLVGSIDDIKKTINSITLDIQTKTDEKVKCLDESQYLLMAVNMLKDTGIKSRIISQFVPLMNQYINEYLQKFDMFVNFELDETFSETIKSRNRDTFTYNSFSQGEKAKIDLSILFTWRRIAMQKNSISTNIIVFDETLDSSLDEESVDTFISILDSIEDETKVFVISHRKVVDEMFERTITIKKVNDFSVLSS